MDEFKLDIELHGLYDIGKDGKGSRYRFQYMCKKYGSCKKYDDKHICQDFRFEGFDNGYLFTGRKICFGILFLNRITYKLLERIVTGKRNELILNLKHNDVFISFITRMMLKGRIGTVNKII